MRKTLNAVFPLDGVRLLVSLHFVDLAINLTIVKHSLTRYIMFYHFSMTRQLDIDLLGNCYSRDFTNINKY